MPAVDADKHVPALVRADKHDGGRWLRWLSKRRWLKRTVIGVTAIWATATVCWWGAVWLGSFPIHLLERTDAASLLVTDASGGTLRQEATSAGTRERWVKLDDISPHLVAATLASEDHDFYDHSGVDWSAMARSAALNMRHGSAAFGGSTLTMQLVRQVTPLRRNLWGKLKQMVLAARLERVMGKRAILEHYLNRVYYGNGAWGAEQAARTYFGKSAKELALAEAALLAVIPRGPTFYDPSRYPERLEQRRRHILSLMKTKGYITPDDWALARRVPLIAQRNRPTFRAPHFVELVKDRLPKGMREGATVRTTLDASLQRNLEVALGNHLDRIGSRNVGQAGLVVLRNRDGAILALVGSANYHDESGRGAWSAATARLRPGSTLKPFVYATALERGDTPATLAADVILPEDVNLFYSKDVRSHGFARYRESLAGSYNLSAVHTLQRVGLDAVLGKLRGAGLVTLDRANAEYDWGLAIGHAEVRLIDLTAAFTTFARGGVPVVPRAIDEARSVDGSVWREPMRERAPVFSPEISYLIYDILADPDARKPMFGDSVPLSLPFRVALKTGTTKAYTDLWAIGTTAEYTVGVWAGNFDGSPTHHVMSSQGATPLLRAAFTVLAARFGDPTDPPRPDHVVGAEVCALSGKRPGPHCTHHKHELFVAGHLPTETCDWHQLRCGKVSVVYPDELHGWARHYRRYQPAQCQDSSETQLAIVTPVDGARFILEPHRSPQAQRPPLAATPVDAAVQWTIAGEPAATWVPRPGTHRVEASLGGQTSAVTIVYE